MMDFTENAKLVKMRGSYNEEIKMLKDPAGTVILMQPWARQEMTTVLKVLSGTPNHSFFAQMKKPDHCQDSLLSEDNTENAF